MISATFCQRKSLSFFNQRFDAWCTKVKAIMTCKWQKVKAIDRHKSTKVKAIDRLKSTKVKAIA